MPRKQIDINLDIIKKDIIPKFEVKQLEDINLVINLFEDDEKYSPTISSSKFWVGVGNEAYMQTSNITVNGNVCSIKVDKNILQKDGRAYGELELIDSSGTLRSSSFIFNIDNSIAEGNLVSGSVEGFIERYEKIINQFKSEFGAFLSTSNNTVKALVSDTNNKINLKIVEIETRVDKKNS